MTPRAVLLGLLSLAGTVLLIHWAELVLGGSRGHTAMANTSIPVGAFSALMLVLAFSSCIGRLRPSWRLAPAELTLIYSMTAVSSVLASSGVIHFMVPAIAAPYHFASAENKWEELIQPYIPPWIGPTDDRLLRRFFDGGETVPVSIWLWPSIIWSGFIFAYAFCSLSIAGLLRHQWIESERLTFPTVYVPLDVTAADGSFWRSKIAWVGMAIPFLIGTLNTLNLNIPSVPKLEVRNIDLSGSFRDAPWNAMGGLSLSFYPFVVGIAFLLSSEVTLSCWFFCLLTKAERIFGALFGLSEWGTGSLSRFPFEEHQGAGAFLGLTAFALWVGRKELALAFRSALGTPRTPPLEGPHVQPAPSAGSASGPDVGKETGGRGARALDNTHTRDSSPVGPPPAVPRWAVWGFLGSLAAMVAFCRAAGMTLATPTALLSLSLIYLIAATRIRAETGNAWLFGPRIDPQTLMVTTIGSRNFRPQDLTIMAYLSSIASFDLRCVSMPHQLDAFKMAEVRGIPRGKLTGALVLSLAVGIPLAFWLALIVWHHIGALGKGDTWRTLMGKAPFDRLQGYLQAPQPPDLLGLVFVGAGLVFTGLLFVMRARLAAWPFHPVGYAIANTASMRNQWFPFLLSWAAKSLILRYGGPKLYRQALPFFFGLVVGDFLNGGLYTLIACFSDKMKVYPINW